MSIRVMAWAFHDSPADLSPAQVLVLVALADAADDTGAVRYLPEEERSQDALAAKCRMSKRTLQRALSELIARGLVVATKGGSIFDPLEYSIPWRQNDATATWRQNDALRSVKMTPRTSIDGIDGVNAREGSPKPKRAGTKPKTKPHPLPADWKPTPEHRAFAAERGIDVEVEADAFRAHAEAHAREAVVWNAAFRQWLIKARPSKPSEIPKQEWPAGFEWMEFNR
jgi:hypothetical protein